MLSTWGEEGFPCLFKQLRVVLPRGFVLAFGSPGRAACWFHAMCAYVCGNPRSVIIILHSHVGSLHW